MKAASPSIVELYAYIYKAGGPVTFEELAEKALHPALRNDSYRAFRPHFESENGVKLPAEDWGEPLTRAAWLWWVEQLLRNACHRRWISRVTLDGSPITNNTQNTPYRASAFALGPKKPYVSVTRTVEKIEPWVPERLQDAFKGNAGGRFLSNLRDGREQVAKMRKGPVREAVLTLLDDAELAVRNSKL